MAVARWWTSGAGTSVGIGTACTKIGRNTRERMHFKNILIMYGEITAYFTVRTLV
jgi:hypothetical protein